MLEMNRKMTALEIDFEDALVDPSRLDPRLESILARGFEEIDGCIVLALFADSARQWAPSSFDGIDLEASENHIHLELELPDSPPAEVRRQAALYVGRLCEELRRAYPALAFVVIMSVSDSDHDSVPVHESVTVRFHRDRPDVSWLVDDLESYELEAVLRLRIPGGSSASL